jgi:hypothetical protein
VALVSSGAGPDFRYSIRSLSLLTLGQRELEVVVVVVDHVGQRRKSAVVIEAAFVNLVRIPERTQRSRSIGFVRRTHGLEIVDPDFIGLVQIPSRFREQRRHMALRAGRLAVENLLSIGSGGPVKAAGRSLRRRQGQLIEMERRQFGRDAIIRAGLVTLFGSRRDRVFRRIIKARVEEVALAVHFEIGDWNSNSLPSPTNPSTYDGSHRRAQKPAG